VHCVLLGWAGADWGCPFCSLCYSELAGDRSSVVDVPFRIFDRLRAGVSAEGAYNIGCDPKDYPTANYINAHPAAYLGEWRYFGGLYVLSRR
jgi:Beta-glucan synthesis-associated protein (SKN1).